MAFALHELTESQRTAALHKDGPLLILAGPGSGKTRVVTHRIANLLQSGVPSRNILALTFTKAAAAEMATRVFNRQRILSTSVGVARRRSGIPTSGETA